MRVCFMMNKPKPQSSHRGAKKGENRFSNFQDARVEANLDSLQPVIRKIQQHGASFISVTQLATFISNDLKSNRPPVPISPSTLLRNPAYRILLDEIIGAPEIRSDVKNSVERAHLEIEIQELRAENRRLRLALEKMLSAPPPIPEKAQQSQNFCETQKLTDLYEIIEALLEASEGQVIADAGSKSIVRSWARTVRHKTVVDSVSASTYFKLKASIGKGIAASST